MTIVNGCTWTARLARLATECLLGTVFLTGVLFGAGIDSAAAAWRLPVPLVPSVGAVSDLRSAVNGAGGAVAVWTMPFDPARLDSTLVRASRRAPGSLSWSAAETLPSITASLLPAYRRIRVGQILDVGFGADGSATVAIEVSEGGGRTGIVVWRFKPDAGWSAPILLADGVQRAVAAIDSAGLVTAAWLDSRAIHGARLAPGSPEPSLVDRAIPRLVDRFDGLAAPLVIGDGGAAMALVFERRRGVRQGLFAYRLPVGQKAWTGPARVISTSPRLTQRVSQLQLAINSSGAAIAAWQQQTRVAKPPAHSSPYRSSIMGRRMSPAGAWAQASELLTARQTGTEYSSVTAVIGTSGLGAVLALEPAAQNKLTATVSHLRTWNAPHVLARRVLSDWWISDAVYAGVTIGDDLVVVWGRARPSGEASAVSSVKPKRGAWRAVTRIPGLPTSVRPAVHLGLNYGSSHVGRRLDIDSGGNLVFGWRPNLGSRLISGSTYASEG